MHGPEVVSSPREPVAVTVLSAFLLLSLITTFFYDRVATNGLRAFPEPWGRVFVLALAVGCGLYLTAAWLDTGDAIVRYERPAWILLTTLFSIFGTWSVALTGVRGTALFLVLFALVIAAQWRLWRIRQWRRTLPARPRVPS